MRARNIKPGFFKNEELADLSHSTRLLFIGLWCMADREGRLQDKPRKIWAELFPYDRDIDVDLMLSELESSLFVIRYEVDGVKYLAINNFVKHQDPHYREKASEIPPPEGQENYIKAEGVTRTQRLRILERDNYTCQSCGCTQHLSIDHILPISRGGDSSDENLQVLCMSCNTTKGNKIHGNDKKQNKVNKSGYEQKFGANSVQGRIELGLKQAASAPLIPDSLIPDSLIPDSLIPDSLIPDSLIDDQDEKTEPEEPDGFSTFWAEYPKKKAKADARKAWRQISPPIKDVMESLDWQKQQPDWEKENGKYVPLPASWIRGRRWEDEPDELPETTDNAGYHPPNLLDDAIRYVTNKNKRPVHSHEDDHAYQEPTPEQIKMQDEVWARMMGK